MGAKGGKARQSRVKKTDGTPDLLLPSAEASIKQVWMSGMHVGTPLRWSFSILKGGAVQDQLM